jgi:DNA-binding NtrC family response regulator
VAQGRFRQDLFYRLSAVVLRIPPLRDRPREIPLLAERFAAEAFEHAGRKPVPIGAATMGQLAAYAWPGNVRELRNVMQAAVMMCDGDSIEPAHLPPQVIAGEPATGPGLDRTDPGLAGRPRVPLDEEIRKLERARIVEALADADGNQTRAAELLGMPRRTLVSKLASLGIEGPRKRRKG